MKMWWFLHGWMYGCLHTRWQGLFGCEWNGSFESGWQVSPIPCSTHVHALWLWAHTTLSWNQVWKWRLWTEKLKGYVGTCQGTLGSLRGYREGWYVSLKQFFLMMSNGFKSLTIRKVFWAIFEPYWHDFHIAWVIWNEPYDQAAMDPNRPEFFHIQYFFPCPSLWGYIEFKQLFTQVQCKLTRAGLHVHNHSCHVRWHKALVSTSHFSTSSSLLIFCQ